MSTNLTLWPTRSPKPVPRCVKRCSHLETICFVSAEAFPGISSGFKRLKSGVPSLMSRGLKSRLRALFDMPVGRHPSNMVRRCCRQVREVGKSQACPHAAVELRGPSEHSRVHKRSRPFASIDVHHEGAILQDISHMNLEVMVKSCGKCR